MRVNLRPFNWSAVYPLIASLLILYSSSFAPLSAQNLAPNIVQQANVGSLPIHPLLLEMAAQQPNQRVKIIVQKQTNGSTVEERITTLGGRIIDDLSIINAVSAEISAQDVTKLVQDDVRWISYDAPTATSGGPDGSFKSTTIQNAYNAAINVPKVWANGYQGSGIGVAVVDSGITNVMDLMGSTNNTRVVANIAFSDGFVVNGINQMILDGYGHGTHIAGIIGGTGISSGFGSQVQYVGVAPKVNLINVKVSDDKGVGTVANVVKGLQWILANKQQYNIRVVNISLNSAVAESYHTSPLDAAVEILWFNGITVVASAGNNGSATLYPPANDPFVITVGAVDDRGTTSRDDDVMASFSAYGKTVDGFAKPDLVAPGRNIVSIGGLATSALTLQHLNNVVVGGFYFRMSGTSMSAPMVSGAVALLLQDEPNLTPDQVKYRLMATANKSWGGYDATKAGAGYLDVANALNGTTQQSANTGISGSKLLWSGSQPVTWNSVNWNSVNWNSVNWNSVNWNSVNWNSVNWNSDFWE